MMAFAGFPPSPSTYEESMSPDFPSADARSSGNSSRPDGLAIAFPSGVFLICFTVAAWFIRINSVNAPLLDDWTMLPWSTGQVPVTTEWLWSQHNEHRIPLAKLILLGAYRVSGHDFRAGCWITLLLLSALSMTLLLLARHWRGRTRWTDAIFPLMILSLANCENLVWSFQVQFAASVLLPMLLLVLMAWDSHGPHSFGKILLLGLGGIALCGFGAASIVYAPFVAAWLIYLAWTRIRTGASIAKWEGAPLTMASILMIAATATYFHGLQREQHQTPSSAAPVIRTMLQFLSLGVTPLLKFLDSPSLPGSSLAMFSWMPLTILLLSGCRLLHVFWSQPDERTRSSALLLMLAGFCSLAVGIGWGRSDQGPDAGFTMRYLTLAIPLVLFAYLIAVLYGPRSRRVLWESGLCLLALVLFLPHLWLGYRFTARLTSLRDFEKDLVAGIRATVIAENYTDASSVRRGPRIYPVTWVVAESVVNLRKLRIGPFQPAEADGASRVEHFEGNRLSPTGLDWDANYRAGRTMKSEATLSISLAEPEYVQRVYLTIHSDRSSVPEYPFQVIGIDKRGEPVTLWRGVLLRGSMPAQLNVKVETEISRIELIWGVADVEFRLPVAMMIAGRVPGPHDAP